MIAGNPPETLGLSEAAALLHMSEDALMRKARRGEIPGAKFGRKWVFVRVDLIELIREQARKRVGRPIDVRTLRTAHPYEKAASRLVQELRAKRRNLKPRLALAGGDK